MNNAINSVRRNTLARKCAALLSHSAASLLIAASLGQAMVASLTCAQTCQDGCFYSNTYQGDDALLNFGSGGQETAFGAYALTNNIDGENNTAIGAYALTNNAAGSDNTAVGSYALYNNDDIFFANGNTATGSYALYSNTTARYNTATGSYALYSNTTGESNTASGSFALYFNTTGESNTASGISALANNTTGNYNTASGFGALVYNITGSSNTAVGGYSLYNTNANNNTGVGNNALYNNSTGTGNIALGESAGSNLTTGNNNIDIGNSGVAGDSKTIRIGTTGTHTKTVIAGIFGTTVAGGAGVIVGSGGKLGTVVSSARFKEEVKPMDKASEAIFALKPVTFRYKKELDPAGISQFGLVAEDVGKVNPDLVARDEDGKPYTVRYEAINAMLLNEFLKEHKKVEQLDATAANLMAIVKEQASQIQKVSAQLKMSKPAPRIANNN